MSDIVERLRARYNCTQFDSAGRLISFEGEPTPLDLEAADEILRLRAELEQAQQAAFNAMEWQPIETAPTDGTRIFACRLGFEPQVVRWNAKWCSLDFEDFDTDDQWHHWYANTEYQPTHWMPLPPPPQEGKT